MKHAKLGILLTTVVAMLAPAAFADIFHTQAPITAVTVFQGQAEVTRKLTFNSAPGRHQLVIENLPGNLLPQSLRIETLRGALEIGAVDLKRQFNIELHQAIRLFRRWTT